MSANVTETDAFSANVPTPVLGDKFTYPATVTDALTKLASRTRYTDNTLMGSVSGAWEFLQETDASVFTPLPESSPIALPIAARGQALRIGLSGLMNKILFTRNLIRTYVWGA